MRIVVALGGNALLRRGQVPDADAQVENIRLAASHLAPLTDEHEIVITHGNGPQVGVLAMESAADPRLTRSYPFDALGAMTQGLIGYWILQAMGNERPHRQFASIINQTLVDADDPAFEHPTKFVGEVYEQQQARDLARRHGWQVGADGDRWRRVVASPVDQVVAVHLAVTGPAALTGRVRTGRRRGRGSWGARAREGGPRRSPSRRTGRGRAPGRGRRRSGRRRPGRASPGCRSRGSRG